MKNIRKIIRKCLNEIAEFDNSSKKYYVPDTVSTNAKNALNNIKNKSFSFDKNEGSGLNKAKELANKIPQTQQQMERLKAFFENNKLNKNSIPWELHGGNAGYEWVSREIKQTKKSNLSRKKNVRFIGGSGTNKGMGIMDIKGIMDTTKQRINK